MGKWLEWRFVDSKLFFKVIKGVETVAGVKAFLILAFYLAVVTWCIGADKLVSDIKRSSGDP